jgi:hypothetical protein
MLELPNMCSQKGMLCKIEANFIKVTLKKILINLFCKQRFGKRNNYSTPSPKFCE